MYFCFLASVSRGYPFGLRGLDRGTVSRSSYLCKEPPDEREKSQKREKRNQMGEWQSKNPCNPHWGRLSTNFQNRVNKLRDPLAMGQDHRKLE